MNDALGDRMKEFYENRTRTYLPRRTYTIIRIDGKAFHTYTRGLKRPFDEGLIQDMNETTKFLCQNVQGVKLGYVQSDEISLVLTDFENLNTSAWFDGNIQKIVSIGASLSTSRFNQIRLARYMEEAGIVVIPEDIRNYKMAQFDARTYSIPSRKEVINYLIWRQQDATRNSIQSVAQSLYSHKQLNGKDGDELQELIFQKGQNWNSYPIGQKRSRMILKSYTLVDSTKEKYEKAKDKTGWVIRGDDATGRIDGYQITRSVWSVVDPPIFSQAKDFLKEIIPNLED
jgi:tRNA(His) guanylyltransferase